MNIKFEIYHTCKSETQTGKKTVRGISSHYIFRNLIDSCYDANSATTVICVICMCLPQAIIASKRIMFIQVTSFIGRLFSTPKRSFPFQNYYFSEKNFVWKGTHSKGLQLGAHVLSSAGNVGNCHRKRTHVL